MAVAPSHHEDAPVVAGDLYARHAAALHAFCLARLRNGHDAEEAVQVTYLRALRALQAGVRPYAERAWLLTIARNVCVSHATRAHRRREIALEPGEMPNDASVLPVDVGTDPELLAALEALPDGQRRAFVLRAVDGLTYDEIATELGVTQAAVETWIFRARRKLAAAVGDRRRRLVADAASLLGGLKGLVGGSVALKAAAAAVVAVTTTTVLAATPRTDGPADPPGVPAVERAPAGGAVGSPATPRRARRADASRRVPLPTRALTPATAQAAPAAGRRGDGAPASPAGSVAASPDAQRAAPASGVAGPAKPPTAPITELVEPLVPPVVPPVIETLVAPVLETPLPPLAPPERPRLELPLVPPVLP